MLQLNNLDSLGKDRKRRGRGGSRGGTSGRGHKGQKARTGSNGEIKGFFEGGQMSLTRRLPRRGFNNNRFRKEYEIISLGQLDKSFADGETVSHETLIAKGLVSRKKSLMGGLLVKLLANGEVTKALTVHVNACSKSAQAAIEKSGGSVTCVASSDGAEVAKTQSVVGTPEGASESPEVTSEEKDSDRTTA